MLAVLKEKKQSGDYENVELVRGSEKNVKLQKNSVDKVLMVDAYHEFNYPVAMIASIEKALRPASKIYLIEYRGEDENIPIKRLRKMTETQAVKEMKAAGLKLICNNSNLPWQHCMVFDEK